MAALETLRPVVVSRPFFGRFGAAFHQVISMLNAWNDARMTRNALARLSDRELEDIGLNRWDIDEISGRNN